jgi:hypothetical protein
MLAAAAAVASPATAQSVPSPPSSPSRVSSVLSARDAQGRFTMRAARAATPLRVDGRLDEPAYAGVEPVSDFIQMEPAGGQPATEKTEVWVFFDQQRLYVTLRAWESRPDLMVANEMRRDSNNIRMGDCVGFSLDTFHDGRNAFQFEVNPLGARTDGQSANERQYSADWNPIWDLAVGRFEGGWTVEAAIPFRSLRYRPGAGQVWGFNARRNSKWKNEISYLARIPPEFGIGRGSFSASRFPSLVGLELPAGFKNLEVKPFIVGDLNGQLTSDGSGRPRLEDDPGADVGVDAKYGITESLTADLTVNTDFAQVEADEQQVNLTRFSLFFPEKREFFLENQGVFAFGGVGNVPAGGGGGAGTSDLPILFYSRRIGLSEGREVPILAGGRMTGRAGRYSLGLLAIGTRDEPLAQARATTFTVARVRRDILRRSSIGALATARSLAQSGRGSNQTYGVDGTFTFFQNLFFNAYWAKTDTTGLSGDNTSYRGQFEYGGDRYGVQVDRLVVGDRFNPEVGYVRRGGMARTSGQLRFSPRPAGSRTVRKLFWIGSANYIENGRGRLETRALEGEFAVELHNSDRVGVTVTDTYELLERPFAIAPGRQIRPGGYRFFSTRAAVTLGQQRPVSGAVSLEHGEFYDGRRTSLGFARTRVNLSSRLSLEPLLSINWLDLSAGAFTTTLAGSRVTYTMTPLMFTSALVQYNSTTRRASTNVRLRWEYQAGSELFVVYNEERDTLVAGFPNLQNRALIVKLTRLFRF